MATARLLVEELRSAYSHSSFRSQLVLRCGVRPAVNETRQTDFLFLETSCGFGRCPLPPARRTVTTLAVDTFRQLGRIGGVGFDTVASRRQLGISVVTKE